MTRALSVQCSATAKSTGERCKYKAIVGGTVCRRHGGSAKGSVASTDAGWWRLG